MQRLTLVASQIFRFQGYMAAAIGLSSHLFEAGQEGGIRMADPGDIRPIRWSHLTDRSMIRNLRFAHAF